METKKILLFVFCSFFILAGCGRKAKKEEVVKTVKISAVEKYGGKSVESFPGKVNASLETKLSFRVSGPVKDISVNEGQFVKKGEIIAKLDPRDYEIQLSAAKAEYEQIKAETERVIKMHKENSVSDNDYDKAISGLHRITAKYKAAEDALSDTELKAPFDGFIQKKLHKKGEIVPAGMPVLSVVDLKAPEVKIDIPANVFINRDKFISYSCSFNIYQGKVFPLELISINKKANLNQLYSARFKILLEKDSFTPTPGMATMVKIYYKDVYTNCVSVPYSSVFKYKGESAVWVYNKKDSKINLRKISIRKIIGNEMVVVSGGLTFGETVVSAGVHSLSEGESVKLLPEVSPTNAGGLL